MPDAAPRRLALLALVSARFYGNGPHPLQLVCTTEDASDAECDQTIAEVEPGAEWDELEAQIVAHAAEHHAADPEAAPPSPSLTAPGVVAGLLADVADARAQLAGVQHGAGAWIREAVARETAGLTARLAEVTAERDKAYRERAHLVAHLAACHPSVMLTDNTEPDWPIVFVSTSAGQMSWHIAKADLELFGHVPATTEPTWDGHTTEEKYQRLAELVRTLSYLGPPAQVDASIAEGKLERALAANQRWAETLGDVRQRHAEVKRERDAHKLRADHYEGLWRAEHGLPPEGNETEGNHA
jgi:hypothetical protein